MSATGKAAGVLRISARSLVTHASRPAKPLRGAMLPDGVRLGDARSRTDPNKSEHAATKEPEKNLKKPEGLQRPISRKTLEIMLDRPSKKKFSEKLKDQSERLIFPFGRTRSAIDPPGRSKSIPALTGSCSPTPQTLIAGVRRD